MDTQLPHFEFDPALDLELARTVDVPPGLIWRAWTEPALLQQWYTPAPWRTSHCEIDLRPGGRFRTVMRGPDGEEHDNVGCFLDIAHERRLVFTDGLGPGFRPKTNSFMTGVITMEPAGSSTHYVARALHSDEDARNRHEAMGFHQGWGAALDQLVALAKTM